MALAAYRHLMRSTRIAFHGDAPLLHAARTEIRNNFRKNASLAEGDPQFQAAVKHAEEVAAILRHNIVQGKREEGDKFKLRIHEDTERGDNDTVKMPNGKTVVIDGKSCKDR